MSDPLFAGIDVGTSGVRAIAIDSGGSVRAQAAQPMAPPQRMGPAVYQDPEIWWDTVCQVLAELGTSVSSGTIAALAVDATSGTLLLADGDGDPVTPGLMYNDTRGLEQAQLIDQVAPPGSGCHGSKAALAKLLYLQTGARRACYALHQADWILGRLCDHFGISDHNNVLKMGYDVVARQWPDWFEALPVQRDLLPEVVEPGTPVAKIGRLVARSCGLSEDVTVVAGTTDGVAAFLATGATEIGDAVTSLGSTLVVKVLSDRPLFAADFGIYSHRLGDRWLAGGASNSGGDALLAHFDRAALTALTPMLDPDRPTGLQYYPLPSPGERFPIRDPNLEPMIEPRPADDVVFFQGLLEGIAEVERRAYRQLEALGAPYPLRIRTVGGGAANPAWTRIRHRLLGVPLTEPVNGHAAYGTALLARKGAAHERG